jgi:hypothetical protein
MHHRQNQKSIGTKLIADVLHICTVITRMHSIKWIVAAL